MIEYLEIFTLLKRLCANPDAMLELALLCFRSQELGAIAKWALFRKVFEVR